MLTLDGGLTLATIPSQGDRWRVVVANTTAAASLQELVTFGLATTTTAEKAQAWTEALASTGLGYALPPATLAGDVFVLDVKFPNTHAILLPLQSIVERWQRITGGTAVVRIVRLDASSYGTAEAAAGRAELLAATAEQLKQNSVTERLQRAGQTALGTLKLGLWAVIIGGAAVLVMKSRAFRK